MEINRQKKKFEIKGGIEVFEKPDSFYIKVEKAVNKTALCQFKIKETDVEDWEEHANKYERDFLRQHE